MKPPAHHAKHLRALGSILNQIHPGARTLLEEAAAQLEILHTVAKDNPGIIAKATKKLIDAGHPTLAFAVGEDAESLEQFISDHSGHPFNPGRN